MDIERPTKVKLFEVKILDRDSHPIVKTGIMKRYPVEGEEFVLQTSSGKTVTPTVLSINLARHNEIEFETADSLYKITKL